jgi:hypothetical protein
MQVPPGRLRTSACGRRTHGRQGCAALTQVLRFYGFTYTMSDTSSQTESKPASVPTEQTPVPAVPATEKTSSEPPAPDPTRYGDWEKNGRCIDF